MSRGSETQGKRSTGSHCGTNQLALTGDNGRFLEYLTVAQSSPSEAASDAVTDLAGDRCPFRVERLSFDAMVQPVLLRHDRHERAHDQSSAVGFDPPIV